MKSMISLKKPQNGILFLSVLFFSLLASSQEDTPVPPANNVPTANAGADQTTTTPANTVTGKRPKVWTLVFEDNFNATGSFDNSKWSYCSRWHPAWAKYLTSTSDYASLDGSNLKLRMDNAVIPGDPVPYHSGGVETQGKVSVYVWKS